MCAESCSFTAAAQFDSHLLCDVSLPILLAGALGSLTSLPQASLPDDRADLSDEVARATARLQGKTSSKQSL